MCLGAILWARIARLYYANGGDDAKAIGFDDDAFYREVMLPPDQRSVPTGRLLAEEARAVFKAWEADPNKIRY